MQFPYSYEMGGKQRLHGNGQHGDAIFIAFSCPDSDLVGAKINVFHPQTQTFHEPQTGPVQEVPHEPRFSLQRFQQRFHLVSAQHEGETMRSFGAHEVVDPVDLTPQYLPVEEHERIERLVLRGRTDVLFQRQCGQKLPDLLSSQCAWMPPALEVNKPPDPVNVGLLNPQTVMPHSDGCPHLVEELGLTLLPGRDRRRHLGKGGVGKSPECTLGTPWDRNSPCNNPVPLRVAKGSPLAHSNPSLLRSENKAKEKISQEVTGSGRIANSW